MAGGVFAITDRLVISLGCKNTWECGPLCFKWEYPTVNMTETILELTSCEDEAADYLLEVINGQLGVCKDSYITDIRNTYINTCASPSNINDRLEMGYTLGQFYYTLFYYDRAGSLVKTVPPKGVQNYQDTHAEIADRSVHPDYTYATTYEYNARRQLVAKTTPDGGQTKYYYNNLGQLRFSQTAQQIFDKTYSYLLYDNLARVLEAGQARICPSCEITNAGELVSKVNIATIPSTGGEERTFSVYNEPTTISYIDAKGNVYAQSFLTNRISYIYNDEDGLLTTADDQSYTYYSYDAHGNIVWLVQEIPGLGNKQIGFEYDLISGKITKVKYQEGVSDQNFYKYNYDADNRLISAQTSVDDRIWETDAAYKYYSHGPMERVVMGEDKVQGQDYIYTLQGWLKAINHPELNQGKDGGQDGLVGGSNQKVPSDAFGMVINYFPGDFDRTGSVFNNNAADASILYKLSDSHGGYSSSSTDMKPYYNGFISNIISNNAATEINHAGEPMVGMYLYDEIGRLTQSTLDFYSGSNWLGNSGSSSDYYEHFNYDLNGNITTVTRNGY